MLLNSISVNTEYRNMGLIYAQSSLGTSCAEEKQVSGTWGVCFEMPNCLHAALTSDY